MADIDKQDVPADSGSEEKQNQASEHDSELSAEIMDTWTAEANNGSEKHQLLLGYHHLKLAELNIEAEANTEKALTWLIAASKQGNVEATEKLRHCVQTNLGVHEQNKAVITWCLNTSASEKKIRHAAKSLFYKINTAQKGFLSKDEYKEAINKLTAGHEKERTLLLAAGNKIGKVISENDFVKILSKKIHGTLTLTSVEMDETNAAYDSAGLFQKVYLYPRQTVMLAFDRGLEYASKEGMNLVLSLIPTNQLYLLTLMLVYSYLTPGFLLLVIPLMGFFISFLVMVISTLQMFYKRRKQKDAVTLATMLQQQFDTDIDLDSTESQYSWNSLTPYFVFFICLPLMIVSFSLTNKSYIPCAELFIVSLVMTGLCFLGLSDSHDLLTLMTLGSHAFASLPIFFAHLPQVPLVTTILELVTQPFFSVYLGLNVSFNISLPSIFYLLIPVLFLCMAIRGSWSGVHKILIPHLVCYFWFSFSTVVFPFTSWTSLVRATVGYMLLPVFIPLSVFLMVIGIPYTIYKLLQTELIGKVIVTGVLLAIPIVLYQTKAFYGKKGEKTSLKDLKFRKIVMISFAVLSILPLLFVRAPTILERKMLTLTWEDYKDLCIPKDDLWAPYQIRCSDFLETEVQWAGKLVQVKATKVENTAENVIKALPSILSEPLYCIYGEKMPVCDEQTMSDQSYRHCRLLRSAGQTCSLHSHNQVFFSLSVQIEKYILNIDAAPNFGSGLLVLEPGDDLEVSGTLTNVGTPSPNLKLKSINCTSRGLNIQMKSEDDFAGKTLLKILNDAVALLFNFFFFPVLEYSAE